MFHCGRQVVVFHRAGFTWGSLTKLFLRSWHLSVFNGFWSIKIKKGLKFHLRD